MKRVAQTVLLALVILIGGRLLYDVTSRAQAGGNPAGNGDVNSDGARDITDAIYLLSWLFQGGPEPVALAGAPDVEERLLALEREVADLRANQASAKSVAQSLVENHLETIRGPAGPPGQGADNELAQAVEHLQDVVAPFGQVARVPFDTLHASTPEELKATLTLGNLDFAVEGFTASEEVSQLYSYVVLINAGRRVLNPDTVVGSNASLLVSHNGTSSSTAGVIEHCGLVADGSTPRYRLVLSPQLSKLSRTKQSRSFQELSASSVAEQILSDAGIAFDMDADSQERSFVVQYNESDLNFLSRLLEDEGIFYFFSADEQELILSDSNSAFGSTPLRLAYHGPEELPTRRGEQYVRTFQEDVRAVPKQFTVRGYDFEAPSLELAGTATSDTGSGEIVEITGVASSDVANARAQRRLQEVQADRELYRGTSNVARLRAGMLIQIDSAGSPFAGRYYVVSVRHTMIDDGKDTKCYANEFQCIPASSPYRTPRVTPKPLLAGTQTAKITAPGGETVHVDEHARVKVKFPWLRNGSADSEWLRVSQPSASDGHGAMFLPEVDDEVLVAFEHGDPDRPVVVGRLYNGENVPPRELPDEKTTSVLLSTTQGNLIEADNRAGEAELVLGSDNIVVQGADDVSIDSGAALRVAASNVVLNTPRTQIAGAAEFSSNASSTKVGTRHRDNAIVAWAHVDASASERTARFGIKELNRVRTGTYRVTLSVEADSTGELIPLVTPLLTAAPRGSADLRFASVSQINANTVDVYISNTGGSLVDGNFTVLFTAR